MPDIILETIELTKNFRNRRAVDALSLRVFEGDVYGFLGPNGAGKSTTIRMLTGLVHPDQGSARIVGTDIRNRRVDALRNVGALVESPSFYGYMSARQNLKLLGRLSGVDDNRRIDQVLDTVGLNDRANDKVKTFSHGMRQRLGIAQALLPMPKLVILDEPTNGLDPQGMRDVRELILRLSREEKVTILLSSHLLHEVEQVCSRVGIISHGKLVAEGEVDGLLRREIGLVEFRVNDAVKAIRVLEGLDWVKIMPSADDNIIPICAPAGRIPEANRALVVSGVDVSAIIPKKQSLEDLFLDLVEEGENAR